MSNQSKPELENMGLMEDLAEMLRAEVLPTHMPLVQLIYKTCEDPTLKQVDLYSKYTHLAAVVGGDWITVKEELRGATRFGAPAFYCSISAMLAVFTCRRSRSHDELVSSLTELYNHISAGNEALNKQIENAITTIGKQMGHPNKAEASFAYLNERVDIALTTIDKKTDNANISDARIANIVKQTEKAVTTIGKQVEQVNRAETSIANIIGRADHSTKTMEKQVNKAEVSITNIIERADQATTMMERQVNKTEAIIANIIERADNAINTTGNQTNVSESIAPPTASTNPKDEFRQDNVSVVPIPGTTYRCKYGTLTIDDRYQCVFNGGSLGAKSLALWFTLPVSIGDLKTLLNWDHEHLIILTNDKLPLLHAFKHTYDASQKRPFFNTLITVNKIKFKPGQWSYIF